MLGGPPLPICSSDAPTLGASWAEDDTIIFGTMTPSGLWRVSANGGEPEELTSPDVGQDVNHGLPHVLPGDRGVLFTIIRDSTPFTSAEIDQAQIALLNLETGEERVLLSGGSAPRYAASGHIVYGANGTLRAVGFDLDRLEVTNPNPVPVLDSVVTKSNAAVNFDLASDGSLVYMRGEGGTAVSRSLVWVARDGREDPLDLEPGDYLDVRVSPDGARLALAFDDDVWTYDTTRGTLGRVTTDPGVDRTPMWTPDGTSLIFQSERAGKPELFMTLADGTGSPRLILSPEGGDRTFVSTVPETWLPDGSTLLFSQVQFVPPVGQDRGGIEGDIGTLRVSGDSAAAMLIDDQFRTFAPAVSPDGRWVAYTSNISGQYEVYAERFPELGSRQQISTAGGTIPRWSPDGTELYYRSVDGRQVLAVSVATDPLFTAGVPQVLFEGSYEAPAGGNRSYDVTPDGERFVMIKAGSSAADGDGRPQVVLVQNWFEELKRLLPVD